MKKIILFLVFMLPFNAFAFDKIFEENCRMLHVPKELAMAIARQESDMNPLAINIAGTDYAPENREAAEKLIRKAQKQNKSFDVGLMQVNIQWMKEWGIDPVTLLEPEINIILGVKILQQEIERHGLNWKAVGSYHSPTPFRARNYAASVHSKLKCDKKLKKKLVAPPPVFPQYAMGHSKRGPVKKWNLPDFANVPIHTEKALN